MKELNLAETGFLSKAGKQTRKAVFLAEMETVVPWSRLEGVIEPFYPKRGDGCPPMPLGTMLRIYFLQQWFGYSDPVMEEALQDVLLLRRFAGLDAFEEVMPDESTILRFRHLLEKHDLAVTIFAEVNAVLSDKCLSVKRGTVVDTDSGLAHTMEYTTAKVADITMMEKCLHGEEAIALDDRGYHKKNQTLDEFEKEGDLPILTPTKKPACGKLTEVQKAFNRMLLAVQAIVEYPFLVVTRQFGFVKVRCRGLAKNTGQIVTLFALVKL